jgi:hypothetical protein
LPVNEIEPDAIPLHLTPAQPSITVNGTVFKEVDDRYARGARAGATPMIEVHPIRAASASAATFRRPACSSLGSQAPI